MVFPETIGMNGMYFTVVCDLTYFRFYYYFTPLRYVPNVAKRSIWDQCKKNEDRPTTDDWPLKAFIWEKFKWPYLRKDRPIHFTLGFNVGCFLGRRIEWRYFRFDQIQ